MRAWYGWPMRATATPHDPRLPGRLVVGGYSHDPRGDPPGVGTGLRVLDLDREAAGGPAYMTVGYEPLRSPTWVVAHPLRPWLVCVTETAPSEVVCLRLEDDGRLTVLGRRTTGGNSACHLALTDDGRQAVVAHYGSGTVETFELDDDGVLTGPLGRFVAGGPLGPDTERQEGPHAHQVVLDPGRPGEVLVCDLGTDRVHRLRLHPDGRLTPAGPALVLPPGFGPRHLVVADDTLVVVGELAAALWAARRSDDGWRATGTVPTTRGAGRREPGGPPLMPSALRRVGDLVLVATRGSDTLSVFALDPVRSTLTAVAEVGCGGRHPRDLVVAHGLVWVAEQESDAVVVLDLAAVRSGEEGAVVHRLPFPRPACLILLEHGSRTAR